MVKYRRCSVDVKAMGGKITGTGHIIKKDKSKQKPLTDEQGRYKNPAQVEPDQRDDLREKRIDG
jgi:hypothetical protein